MHVQLDGSGGRNGEIVVGGLKDQFKHSTISQIHEKIAKHIKTIYTFFSLNGLAFLELWPYKVNSRPGR